MKIRFVMQPLQNPPLSSSTDESGHETYCIVEQPCSVARLQNSRFLILKGLRRLILIERQVFRIEFLLPIGWWNEMLWKNPQKYIELVVI